MQVIRSFIGFSVLTQITQRDKYTEKQMAVVKGHTMSSTLSPFNRSHMTVVARVDCR